MLIVCMNSLQVWNLKSWTEVSHIQGIHLACVCFKDGYLAFANQTSNPCFTINFDIDATLHTNTLNCMMFTETAQEDNQLREKTIKCTEI